MYRMAWSHELTEAQKAIKLIYCPWGAVQPYKLPYTLFENPMTFSVFGLLNHFSYVALPTKYNMYRADPGQAADHRNG